MSAKPASPVSSASSNNCLHFAGTGLPDRLSAIQMVDSNRGWAVGGKNILTSSDGQDWTTAFRGIQNFVGIDFVSSSTGWAVSDNQLLGTTDGGLCWVPLGEPLQALRSVHFADPTAGWGVAGGALAANGSPAHGFLAPDKGGTLVSTVDGGRTWTAAAAPANAQTVCFGDRRHGWLGTTEGAVYRTTDGGAHWTDVLNRPGQYPGNLSLLQCAAPHAAWVDFEGGPAAAGHIPYIVYATSDGERWRTVVEESMTEEMVAPNVPPGPGCYPGSFSVIDTTDAAFVGDCGNVASAATVLAAKGGATVTRTGVIADVLATDGASFVSTQRGWVLVQRAGGSRYAIEATTDGGKSWSAQMTSP